MRATQLEQAQAGAGSRRRSSRRGGRRCGRTARRRARASVDSRASTTWRSPTAVSTTPMPRSCERVAQAEVAHHRDRHGAVRERTARQRGPRRRARASGLRRRSRRWRRRRSAGRRRRRSRDPRSAPCREHLGGEGLGMSRAAAGVDVRPIGLGREHDELLAEAPEDLRGDRARGAVRAVEHDAQKRAAAEVARRSTRAEMYSSPADRSCADRPDSPPRR